MILPTRFHEEPNNLTIAVCHKIRGGTQRLLDGQKSKQVKCASCLHRGRVESNKGFDSHSMMTIIIAREISEDKMQDTTTVKKLFDESDIQFSVPAYQRAYSWEVNSDKKQVKQFLQDLIEQIDFTRVDEEGKIQRKIYFLGHFLFENNPENSNKYWIIDGQQRLTTIVIFMSAFISEIEKRKKSGENIVDLEGKEFRVNRLRENYLIKDDCAKFESVAYDNSDFYQIIYESNRNYSGGITLRFSNSAPAMA